MRQLLVAVIFILISGLGQAQSITISETTATRNHTTSQFLVAGHQVAINNSSPAYAKAGISANINVITAISASLNNEGVSIYAGNGQELFTSAVRLQSDEASLKVYSKPNGGFIIRENIANFLFYDALGNIMQSVSNSSQSPEGESISELAADPAYKTVVLYNPKIIREGREGSRARIVRDNWTTRDIFYSGDRAIRFVRVSENGQFAAIVSYKSGTDDEVNVTDRFGNDLGTFSFNQDIADVKFARDGQFITIRSSGRVGVYSLLNGERIGSTSFRSSLHFAEYIGQDETVIAVTGDKSGSVLSGVEIHAINLDARSIEREEYDSNLGLSEMLNVQLDRRGSGNYLLSGMSRALNLNVRF